MERLPDDLRERLDEDFFFEQPERATVPTFDVKAGHRLDRHEKRLEEEFHVHGVGTMTASQAMDWIVNRTYEGDSLLKLSRIKGAPNMRKISCWKRDYPSFAEELKSAEEARAYILVEEAVDAAVQADKETAGAAKVRFQAATWNASKLNPNRYTERKIEERVNTGLEGQSTNELLERLRASIGANAEVIHLLSEKERKQLGMVIDVEPIPEKSPP